MQNVLELAAVTLAVALPFLVALALRLIYTYRIETAKHRREQNTEQSAAELVKLQATLVTLQGRVATLEAIVTDQRYELDRELANIA